MVNYCCVYRCSYHIGRKTEKRSFHKFPNKDKSPQLYQQWLDKVNRECFIPNKYTVVCSAHFLEDDFELKNKLKLQLLGDDGGKSQAILKRTAVPSLQLTGTSKPNVRSTPRKGRKSMLLSNKEETELLNLIPEDCSLQIASSSKSNLNKCARPVAAASMSQTQSGKRKRKTVKGHVADKAPTSEELFSHEISIQCELGVEKLRMVVLWRARELNSFQCPHSKADNRGSTRATMIFQVQWDVTKLSGSKYEGNLSTIVKHV